MLALTGGMDVGKYSDDGLLGARLETGRVVAIDDGGTGQIPIHSFWIDGVWQFSPMNEIFADGVAPVQQGSGAKLHVIRIVLIEQVIFAAMKHQPVGIA